MFATILYGSAMNFWRDWSPTLLGVILILAGSLKLVNSTEGYIAYGASGVLLGAGLVLLVWALMRE
jgi:hypothetical protein